MGSLLLYSKDIISVGCVYLYIICMYVCMHVCMYICIYMSTPLHDSGWVGGSLYKVSYKSNYGSKVLDQESWGEEINSKVIWRGVVGRVIWLHLHVSRAKWKHFMIDKTHTSLL